MVRHHVAEIHHRHQRLAAREHARVVVRREQIARVGHGVRIVVDEWGGFHELTSKLASHRYTQMNTDFKTQEEGKN
jgi:hypothetical protein